MSRTAIVCGAGMAGLLSARVLSDFFDDVVLVERDVLLDEPTPRKGVPQGNYLHALLVGGQRILSGLFPGFVEEMVTHGAHHVCFTSSRKRYHVNAWQPRPESDLWTLFCSRGMLEWGVRRRVLKLPNVWLLDGRRIVAPSTSDADGTVTGVRTKSADGSEATLHADLVVDATGRGSAGPKWLASLGYPMAEETIVNGFWGYASRNYRMPDGWAPDWAGMVTFPTGQAGNTRGAGWVKQEHGRWLLTLFGCAQDYPPRDEQGFADWLTSLPVPDFAEPLTGATPLDDIVLWRQTANRLRSYDQLVRRPKGLLFTGDSVCALNPVFGQGMTVACLGARELQATLAEGWDNVEERYQRRFAEALRFSWTVSTSADHAVPGAEGDAPAAEEAELGHRWRRAQLLANDDAEVMRLFWETVCLVRPPDWLYHGDIADRIDAELRIRAAEVNA